MTELVLNNPLDFLRSVIIELRWIDFDIMTAQIISSTRSTQTPIKPHPMQKRPTECTHRDTLNPLL
jgi:hypothetical protein